MLKSLRPTITLPLSHLACESSLTLAKCHGLRVLAFVCLMHSHTGPLLNWLTDALPRAHRYHPDLGYVGDGPPETEAEAKIFARCASCPGADFAVAVAASNAINSSMTFSMPSAAPSRMLGADEAMTLLPVCVCVCVCVCWGLTRR